MIEIDIRLKSARGPHHNRVLGRGLIVNDGTGTPTRGNYYAHLKTGRGKIRTVIVQDFPRRSRDVWELLRRILNAQESLRSTSKRRRIAAKHGTTPAQPGESSR